MADTKPGEHREDDINERVVPFIADDGMQLNLVNVQGHDAPRLGPVVLVHGAGVRGNIFRAPVDVNLVDALVAQGYDVWLENWRASTEVPPNEWTLDQAAKYDHPRAVQKVVEETGHDHVKAVIHCQGSTSFMMSAVSGLLPQVDTIITNAVSLHTVVPTWSRVKLSRLLPLLGPFLTYLNPGWADQPPQRATQMLTLAVKMFHKECHNTACKMVSFTYGAGNPALWRHGNLNEETHSDWLEQEFGHVPLSFFRQMARCVEAGHLVSQDNIPGLPADFTAQSPLTDARFVFMTGRLNKCFLPESQRLSHAWFSRHHPDYHSIHEVAGYSHLDMFMGKNAAKDVFPRIIEELQGQR